MRNRIDAELVKTTALPAAGSTSEAGFDLEQVNAGDLEQVVVEVEVPSTTTLVATKKLTFGYGTDKVESLPIQANGMALELFDIVGKTNNGSDGNVYRFRLPVDCDHYFSVGCTAESGAGNNTAKSFTVRLLT